MTSWDWNIESWGQGAAFAIGIAIGLAIAIIPMVFFLLNLSDLLRRVSDKNRAMSPGKVWLVFIPLFGLGWFPYMVAKIRDSVRDEFFSRGWAPQDDQGYGVGMATAILSIAYLFLQWVPGLGWVISVATLVCFIVYWVKTYRLKQQLGPRGFFPAPGPGSPPPGQGYSSDSTKRCAACGAAADPGDTFCRSCGTPLS